MKNTLLMVLASFLLVCPAFAQNNYSGSVKESVVMTLMDYGVQLFNRHNYPEAEAVFNRVLAYDPNQQAAQRYLNQINPSPIIPESHQVVIRMKSAPKATIKPEHAIALPKQVVKEAPAVLTEDPAIADLRQRINSKEDQINQLKIEIDQLRPQAN